MLKKNIPVTGASSGFGRAIVEYLSHQGYTVVGTSRNIEVSEKNINFLKLNVDDDVSVREAVNSFVQEYEQIDIFTGQPVISQVLKKERDYERLNYSMKSF